jgi:hypothetical protein
MTPVKAGSLLGELTGFTKAITYTLGSMASTLTVTYHQRYSSPCILTSGIRKINGKMSLK